MTGSEPINAYGHTNSCWAPSLYGAHDEANPGGCVCICHRTEIDDGPGGELVDENLTAWPTESQVMAEVAKAEYASLSDDEKAASKARWDALPEWRKRDLEDEVEFDLL